MSIQWSFVFIDFTTDTTPNNLRPAGSMQAIIDALIETLEGKFSDAYGEVCCNFRIASSQTDRQTGEIAVNFRDTLDVQGALAYHTVTNGIPDIEIGCDLFTDLIDTTESISGGTSHEIFELLGDPGANEWADRQDSSGLMDARENCDFVQNTGWKATNGVWISNFVLPSKFIPGASGPWDAMGVMTSSDDVSNGYGIVVSSPTSEQQIGGENMAKVQAKLIASKAPKIIGKLSKLQAQRKSLSYSRTTRRNAKVNISGDIGKNT